MANQVSFTIRLDDHGTFKRVTMNAEELGRAVRSVQDESEKAKRSVISWAEASQAASVLQDAVGELHETISDLTDAWKVQIVAETQLQTVMRQRMGATDEQIQSIKDLCSAQQELGVIGDEVQLSGAQQMATFLKEKQSLDTLIPAMNNLIAQQNGLNATNQDAVSIGNMMGKAMQGQVEVLQRVGITFDDAQKKVLQYGTESERAAMLAKVITQNVGNMNAELAKTESGKQKQLENTLGDIKEQLGEMVEGLEPAITYLAQFSMAATGIGKLATSFIAVSKAVGLTTVAGNLWNATSVRMNALTTTCSATMRGAAVSATTLKLAIQGLMIATGVGLAVAALTTAISYLMGSSEDAAESTNRLTDAQQRAQQAHQQEEQQMAGVRGELIQNIAALKNFKGSKEDEKKLVQQMNTKYGEAMGYYSTVAQWYQALTANSKTYCDQMVNEIRIRNLANDAADLDQKMHDTIYDSNGKKKKFSTSVDVNDPTVKWKKVSPNEVGKNTQMINGEYYNPVNYKSQKDKAEDTYKSLKAQRDAKKRQMETLAKQGQNIKIKHTAGYSATPPSTISGSHTTGHTTHGNTGDDAPLQGSIDWYNKQISKLTSQMNATATADTRKKLQSEIEGLQRELGMVKVKAGIETPPPIEVKKQVKPMAQQIEDAFDEMQQHLKQNPIKVEADPKKLEELEKKLKDTERLMSLGHVDLKSYQGVQQELTTLKGITDPTAKGMAVAGESCAMLGSALQQLGANSAAAKAGMVMAAIGQVVLSFAQALSSCKTWVEWLAFGISGTAQMISIISTLSQFATGGIVGGNQKSGDNVLVRVNSGEMILNAAQQARLFALANGAAVYGASAQVQTSFGQGIAPGVKANTSGLQGIVIEQGQNAPANINLRLRGRDIVAAVANETRSNRKRSNIRIG